MDSKDNFLRAMKDFLSSIDEEYLIGVSNKGIVNRSKKDLEAAKDSKVEIEEQAVNLILLDGTVCTLSQNIKDCKCSCPSRTICKHVIMGFLYLKNNLDSFFPFESNDSSEGSEVKNQDFSPLLEISLDDLMESAGEKSFNEMISRIRYGVKGEIEESSLLTIRFKEEDNTVKFIAQNLESSSPKELLTEAYCSCKSKELCRHKLEALVNYQLYKGSIKKEDLKVYNKKLKLQKTSYLEATALVKKALEEIIFVGLSRLPETTVENLETLSLICHNANIPSVEKQLRNIKTDIELYIKKNASFSLGSLKNKISNIYAAVIAIENLSNIPDREEDLRGLCGEHRSAYYDIPPMELWGLGAESWKSKSGYEGTTYYFYENIKERLFTYTNSRPTFYDRDKRRSFNQNYSEVPSWGIEGTLEEISKSGIRLTNAKINEEGRISASEGTKGEILGKTDINELNLSKFLIEEWDELIDKFLKGITGGADFSENLYIIKPESFGNGSFDSIKQRFTLPMQDKKGNIIYMLLDFSSERKRLIQRFERMERTKRYPASIFGKLYVIDGNLSLIPMIAYKVDGTIVNLTLEV